MGKNYKVKLEWKGDEAIKAIEKAQEEFLTKAAVVVHGQASELSPVDTGNLKGSLNYAVDMQDEDGPAAHIGTNTEYAPYVEMGTSKMAAQPYLRPALDGTRDELVRMAEKIKRKHLRKDFIK